jgi:hypothetical protein
MFAKEGLNSVKYKVIEIKKTSLYTKIRVSYNEKELLNYS